MKIKSDKGLITLIILILASTVTICSQSIITTSFANIMNEFSISSTTVQWTYSAFLLVLGVMIPPTAFITKRFKIKSILSVSLILFLIGSVICYLCPNIELLIVGRVIQACGTGILMPITQIIIFKVIPEEKWSMFMGLFGFIVGISPALAPTFGGIIADAYTWRLIFAIFSILALIILILTLTLVNFSLETEEYPLDVPSLIMSIIMCVGIMIGFSNIAEHGFDILYVILPIIIGIITLILFVKRQKAIESPLVNLKVLKNKYFVLGTSFAALLYFTMCGINVMVPLFVQNICLYSSTTSGLVLLPATVIMILFNFIGPLLSDKIGIRKVLILSSVFSIIGFASMMNYDLNCDVNYMIITQIIRGIGAGLGLTPAITWTMSVVVKDVEDATAINNTLRQIIGAIGSSVTVVIMQIFANGFLTNNQTSVTSFNNTSLIMIFILIIVLIISLFIKNKREIGSD